MLAYYPAGLTTLLSCCPAGLTTLLNQLPCWAERYYSTKENPTTLLSLLEHSNKSSHDIVTLLSGEYKKRKNETFLACGAKSNCLLPCWAKK